MQRGYKYLLVGGALTGLLIAAIGAGGGGGDFQPPPVLGALHPSKAEAGSPGFALTVQGAHFVSGAIVHWNGEERATTVVDPGVVRAQIPASDLASDGTASVIVVNPNFPDQRSGVSNALAFRVVP